VCRGKLNLNIQCDHIPPQQPKIGYLPAKFMTDGGHYVKGGFLANMLKYPKFETENRSLPGFAPASL